MINRLSNLRYYLFTTYRRKNLDDALEKHRKLFKGKVLDIGGGRKDGRFIRPQTEAWVVADIDKSAKPDVIASVESLPFKDKTFDVIKATELFEHVANFEKGFSECARVLKNGGVLIVSSPFLYPTHSDPYDFQRINLDTWKRLARENKLKIVKVEEQGYLRTMLGDIYRSWVVRLPAPIRYTLYLSFPLVDRMVKSEGKNKVTFGSNYVEGYFIIFKK